MNGSSRPRIGEILLAAGVIDQQQLDRALTEQSSWGGQLGQTLVALGFIDEATLARAVANQLKLPLVDLDRSNLPAEARQLVPVNLAEQYGLMPLHVDRDKGRLLVACFDPTHGEALRLLRRASGLMCDLAVATPSSIDRAIRRLYYGEATDAPVTAGPNFNVTRNAIGPTQAVELEQELDERLAALEQRVDRLFRIVEALEGRLAPPGVGRA